MAQPATATPATRFYTLFYRWSSAVGGSTHQIPNHPLRNPATRARYTSTKVAATSSHARQRPHRRFSTSQSHANDRKETSLAAQMRLLMRRIPHPVVILTATHPPSASGEQDPKAFDPTDAQHFRGMTVSSFNTVCMEPYPIVSFNMKLPSRTYDAVKANDGVFLIQLLHGGVESARLADGFTRGQEEVRRMLGLGLASGDESDGSGLGGSGAIDLDVDIDVGVDVEARYSPVISGPAVARVLRCRLLAGKEMRVEDHVVLCAEVLSLRGPEEEIERGRVAGLSLVYVDREFREVGKAIDRKKG